jgi:hypothetical protein
MLLSPVLQTTKARAPRAFASTGVRARKTTLYFAFYDCMRRDVTDLRDTTGRDSARGPAA